MKSKILKKQGCNREFEVEVAEAERFEQAEQEAYKELRSKVSVPGFRRGKATIEAIKRYYPERLDEEKLKILISNAYQQALEDLSIEPVAFPNITDIKMDQPDKIYFKASVDIKPEVTIKSFKQMKPKLPEEPKEPEQSEIDEVFEGLRKQDAKIKAAGEGEEKQEELPELNDDFAKDLGFDDLEKLKEAVVGSVKQRKQHQYRNMLEEAIVDSLISISTFDLPESLVLKQMAELGKMFGGAQQPNEEMDKKIREIAERQLRVSFIFEKISEEAGIPGEQVMNFLIENIVKPSESKKS